MTTDITRLLNMAAGCRDALHAHADHVIRLQEELKSLDGSTCNGREYWRDLDHPNRDPKLYIIHSIDQACPVHGEPEPGSRIRVYVGAARDNIREAQAAIARERRRQELDTELANSQCGLHSCGWYLESFYRALGIKLNMDGKIISAGPCSPW